LTRNLSQHAIEDVEVLMLFSICALLVAISAAGVLYACGCSIGEVLLYGFCAGVTLYNCLELKADLDRLDVPLSQEELHD
jgi:hypothetical protein